jgi:lipid A ethanolaminephosphotransferase
VALVASVFFALFCNLPLWRALLAGREADSPSTWGYAAALFVALVALQFVLLALVVTRRTAKPLLTLLLVTTAVASYYMHKYGVFMDSTMVRNVLRTDAAEARELIDVGLVVQLILGALLPSLLLWRLPLRSQPLFGALLRRIGVIVVGIAVAVGALLLVFQDISSKIRNERQVRYLVTPANYVWSLFNVLLADSRGAQRAREVVGADAKLGPRWDGRARPALLVIVVGETVRAMNWGLNGYARQTTPMLAGRSDVINFPDVTSCGTNTETSLPCMFSPWGRKHYDEGRIRNAESLLNVFRHAGIDVLWRDNQSGCKGVCTGIEEQTLSKSGDPQLCDGERCLDEILLRGLPERLATQQGPQVLVLHQLGNHGPAYYKRYPPAFRRFMPSCDSADLRQCSREQIVNAYDNAILYTDHVLSQLIQLLQSHSETLDSAMIYVSDHGESLGESGLFLHGVPYPIAPSEQTKVPMIMWFSPGFAQSFGLDLACLRSQASQRWSHDNLFHTALGLLDVRTAVHDASMDLSASCRH